MTRPVGMKLTPEVARELCQRAGKQSLPCRRSIGNLGSEYVLGLEAVNCQSGDTLAQEQVTAASKEKVLDALGDAASKLRGELGESLATVQKFDVPLVQETTSSLEALKAYSLGQKTLVGKGDWAAAVPMFRRAIRLDPNFAMAYATLGVDYSNLGETSLASENTKKAYELRERVSEREKFYIESHYYHYVTGDLGGEADTAAYSGRLAKARELSRRAVTSAERAEEKENAAGNEAEAALREALFGNAAEARQRAAAALRLSTGRDVQLYAALALAFAGDSARVRALADDLAKRFPEDTVVQFSYLATIHAQLALDRNEASKAIETLRAAVPYELGAVGGLYPVYVRGEAYLASHQGSEATAEFQKILDHCGVVQNEPIGALAHLGLARAYSIQNDTAKARSVYQDFLTLWTDADPDIPILQQAKAEYSKLK
jgi:tetratricopeptide (TPR) repeat protein